MAIHQQKRPFQAVDVGGRRAYGLGVLRDFLIMRNQHHAVINIAFELSMPMEGFGRKDIDTDIDCSIVDEFLNLSALHHKDRHQSSQGLPRLKFAIQPIPLGVPQKFGNPDPNLRLVLLPVDFIQKRLKWGVYTAPEGERRLPGSACGPWLLFLPHQSRFENRIWVSGSRGGYQ